MELGTETLERPSGVVNESLIETAIRSLKARVAKYNLYHAYYSGKQPLTFASEQYRDYFARVVSEYSENLCPAVIESLSDRLTVTGFTQDGEDTDSPTSRAAWDLWRENRMDENAGKVHTEALKAGDAFVIVWPDAIDATKARIWPQDANGCTIHYDEETGNRDWAAKWWLQENQYGRLNIYTAESIKRYITLKKVRTQDGFPSKSAELTLLPDEGEFENTFGEVPVFQFANNALISNWGVSELRDVLPLQDALNKAVCDMLVGMEFNAYPQRWATGLQVKRDPETGKPIADFMPGADRIWSTASKEAVFGQFDAANLEQLIAVQNRFKTAVADVTGTPSHYLQMTPTTWPSGESLKTAEARFIAKAEKRQVAFGNVWEDVIRFALRIQGMNIPDQSRVSTVWKNAAPRSEMDFASTAVLKKQFGVPDSQLQKEAGYTDEEIARFAEEVEAQKEADMERQQQVFNAGPNAREEDEE